MKGILGLFPLNTVLVPGGSLRLHVFEDRYKLMIGRCIDLHEPFGVLLDRNGREAGEELDPVDVGTIARIREVTRLPQGRLFIHTNGVRRFRVDQIVQKVPYWAAEISYLPERLGSALAAQELRDLAAERFREYLGTLLSLLGRDLDEIRLPEDACVSSYLIADALQVDTPVKQHLLEIDSAAERLQAELAVLDVETRRLRALASGESSGEELTSQAAFGVGFSLN